MAFGFQQQRSFVPPLSSQERRRSTVGVPSNAMGAQQMVARYQPPMPMGTGYMGQGYSIPPVQDPGPNWRPQGAQAEVYRPWMQNHPAYQGQVVSGPSRPSFVPPMGNAVQLAEGGRFGGPLTRTYTPPAPGSGPNGGYMPDEVHREAMSFSNGGSYIPPIPPTMPQIRPGFGPTMQQGAYAPATTQMGMMGAMSWPAPSQIPPQFSDLDSQHAANMAFAQQAMQQAQQQRQQIASQWNDRSNQLMAGGGGYSQQPLMPGRGGSMIPPRPQQQPMMAGNPTDAAWAMGQQRRFTPPMAQPGGYGPPSPGSQMQMAGGPGSMVPIDSNSEVLRPRTEPFMNAGYHGGGSDQSGPSQIPITQRGGSTYVDLNNVPEGERFGVGTAPGMGWVDRQRQRDGLPGLVVQSHGDGTGELVRRPGYHPPGSPENPYTADQLAKQQAGRDARAEKKDRIANNRRTFAENKGQSLVPPMPKKSELVDGKDKQGRQVATATPVSQSFHIPSEGAIRGVGEQSDTFRAMDAAMHQANGNKAKLWRSLEAQGVDRQKAMEFAKWLHLNPEPLSGIAGALAPEDYRKEVNSKSKEMNAALEAYFEPEQMNEIRQPKQNREDLSRMILGDSPGSYQFSF